MKKHADKIFLIAVLLPLLLFVFPMWKIKLIAPQYPDGISMYIWISKITGDSDATLQNINILNHYVGMKFIEPESIPELQYFPWIVLSIVVLGLLVWWSRKRVIYLTWSILLTVLGGLGIYDFYLWEYDYGHNLSPDAPIKIPGATYQPPLIGTKWLLNFKADSWPDIGGIALGMSILLGFLSYFLMNTKRDKVKLDQTSELPKKAAIALLVLVVAFFNFSCSKEKEDIRYGEDSCVHCMMKIVQPQYGAEIVTNKGKVFKFDAVECLLDFEKDRVVANEDIYQRWVVSYTEPQTLFPAEECFYLRSQNLPSPMGMFITAISEHQRAKSIQQESGGKLYSWEEIYDQYPNLDHLSDRIQDDVGN